MVNPIYLEVTGHGEPLPKPAAAQLIASEALLAHKAAELLNFALLNFHMRRLVGLLKEHPDLTPNNLEFLSTRLYLINPSMRQTIAELLTRLSTGAQGNTK